MPKDSRTLNVGIALVTVPTDIADTQAMVRRSESRLKSSADALVQAKSVAAEFQAGPERSRDVLHRVAAGGQRLPDGGGVF